MFLLSNGLKMKIGLVIHGPEVIDSGEAKNVFDKLSCLAKLNKSLEGLMGKVAVLDAGLENFIDITRHQKPSACIYSLLETSTLRKPPNLGKNT